MKVLVAMSGGVDSSVAAALMKEEGHEVIGVTLKQWENEDGSMPAHGCCTLADSEDARRVAAQLGIPYYVFNYVEEFRSQVVDRFGAEYLAGRTPNPCVECNRRVRFSSLVAQAAELGCELLATGHYARVVEGEDGYRLLRGLDHDKDQSYVLYMLGQEQLRRTRFPVGDLTKADTREMATQLGLRTADKPDSQDVCFIERDYRSFLRRSFPEAGRPGEVVDRDGTALGTHEGIADFTIGQRRGLGVAVGERRYVTEIRPESRTVVLGTKDDLLAGGCLVDDVSFVSGRPPADDRLGVRIRYRSDPVPSRLRPMDGRRWEVVFDRPQAAVTPGQAAVFSRAEEVLGGGTIQEAR